MLSCLGVGELLRHGVVSAAGCAGADADVAELRCDNSLSPHSLQHLKSIVSSTVELLLCNFTFQPSKQAHLSDLGGFSVLLCGIFFL